MMMEKTNFCDQKRCRTAGRIAKLNGSQLQPFFFSTIILLGVALFWLTMLLTRSELIDAYFVTDHGDTSMDYFNMLSNLNNPDPWYANANYPAMVFLFMKIMHRFLPSDEYGDGFFLRSNMVAQLGYILFVVICLIIISETIKCLARGSRWEKLLFTCSILFSGPMFYLLERGNILLAVLPFSLLFLALYDSEKTSLRMISYVCLAIAAAIKIYPAVLGLLVLWKKRYKEALVLIVIGVIAFLGPFFVFDGIESLQKMIYGVTYATNLQTTALGFGYNFCIDNLIQMVAAVFGHYLLDVPGWVAIVAAVFCVCLFVASKYEWQKLYALVLLCIWFPGFSYTYTLVLLFLPIISYLYRTEEWQQGRFRIWYTIAFALILVPYALPEVETINRVIGLDFVKFPVHWGMIIINALMVLVALMIVIDTTLDKQNNKKLNFK